MTRSEALTWCVRCFRFLAVWISDSISGDTEGAEIMGCYLVI